MSHTVMSCHVMSCHKRLVRHTLTSKDESWNLALKITASISHAHNTREPFVCSWGSCAPSRLNPPLKVPLPGHIPIWYYFRRHCILGWCIKTKITILSDETRRLLLYLRLLKIRYIICHSVLLTPDSSKNMLWRNYLVGSQLKQIIWQPPFQSVIWPFIPWVLHTIASNSRWPCSWIKDDSPDHEKFSLSLASIRER